MQVLVLGAAIKLDGPDPGRQIRSLRREVDFESILDRQTLDKLDAVWILYVVDERAGRSIGERVDGWEIIRYEQGGDECT